MNAITAAAILQLLLVVGGSRVPGEGKRVGCYYFGATTERHGTLYPEDIDASICTHLFYVHGAINNETQEIYLKPPMRYTETGGDGFVPRLVTLKAVNPDLKLILHIINRHDEWLSQEPSKRSKMIQSGVKWLNESGFDGLDFDSPLELEDSMKNEFDKYGFSVTTSLNVATEASDETVRKIARCSDSIALVTHYHEREFHRIAPLSMIKSNVDRYIEKGLSPSRILIIVPVFGAIFTIEDQGDTKEGARVYKPGNEDQEIMDGLGIRNRELLSKLNDSSLGWTIHRDNETKEPYAFTTTGLWTSYEDTTSMEYKARYVLEKGLGGINIVALEFDDDERIREGKFPLTRAIYNTFSRENKSADSGN
ncbi:hypothetical protein J437_LFUL014765 [Ladona fulva]|uniref:GH18 domain-containing protein n=1 Tax=Ladona fulva TaxID=123851 RepID=A0A8K0P3H8_LADFU|nr:hypothetical protein J437_LFUL014765 [Ladona fulva]